MGRYLHLHNLTVVSKATYSNSHTDSSGCHARCWPAHQEQSEVQYLAQGHFNVQTRGIEPATFQWQDTGSTTEPQMCYQTLRCVMEAGYFYS